MDVLCTQDNTDIIQTVRPAGRPVTGWLDAAERFVSTPLNLLRAAGGVASAISLTFDPTLEAKWKCETDHGEEDVGGSNSRDTETRAVMELKTFNQPLNTTSIQCVCVRACLRVCVFILKPSMYFCHGSVEH